MDCDMPAAQLQSNILFRPIQENLASALKRQIQFAWSCHNSSRVRMAADVTILFPDGGMEGLSGEIDWNNVLGAL